MRIAELAKELDERLAALEAKRAEYEDWVKRREEFLSRAEEAVVAIYRRCGRTPPPQQIRVDGPETAAAMLAKLNPRTASAILNEMDAHDGRATSPTSWPAGRPKKRVAGNT